MTDSTMAELVAADRLNSPSGQAALLLARRLDGAGMDTGSSIASMVREHRAALEAALDGAAVKDDPLALLGEEFGLRIV